MLWMKKKWCLDYNPGLDISFHFFTKGFDFQPSNGASWDFNSAFDLWCVLFKKYPFSTWNGAGWDFNSWFDLWCVLPCSKGIHFQLRISTLMIWRVMCFCRFRTGVSTSNGQVGISTHDLTCDVLCKFRRGFIFNFKWGMLGVSTFMILLPFKCQVKEHHMLKIRVVFSRPPHLKLKKYKLSLGPYSTPMQIKHHNVSCSLNITHLKLK